MTLTIKEGLAIIQSCLDDNEDGQGYLFDFFKGPRGKGWLKKIETQKSWNDCLDELGKRGILSQRQVECMRERDDV